jgi:hypothetical protein
MTNLDDKTRWQTQMTKLDDKPRWQTQMTSTDDKHRWQAQMTSTDDKHRWQAQMTSTDGKHRWQTQSTNPDDKPICPPEETQITTVNWCQLLQLVLSFWLSCKLSSYIAIWVIAGLSFGLYQTIFLWNNVSIQCRKISYITENFMKGKVKMCGGCVCI